MSSFNFNRITSGRSRSISPENPSGEPGQGGKATEGLGKLPAERLGQGWKVSPCIAVKAGSTTQIAAIKGEGCINHFWMTAASAQWKDLYLIVSFEGAKTPAVEVPLACFFLNGWGNKVNVNSAMITVNPSSGFNSYWPMPFRKAASFKIENRGAVDAVLYFQIDYELRKVEADEAYFHAVYKEKRPLRKGTDFEIVPKLGGQGQLVGIYLGIQPDCETWWGEGEVKMFIDGDSSFPTICGTGTEDFFGGAWNFEQPQGHYQTFSTAYQGLIEVDPADAIYQKGMRFGMYRWLLSDPIRFSSSLRVTVQTLGWENDLKHYLVLAPNIFSVAYFYLKDMAGKEDL